MICMMTNWPDEVKDLDLCTLEFLQMVSDTHVLDAIDRKPFAVEECQCLVLSRADLAVCLHGARSFRDIQDGILGLLKGRGVQCVLVREEEVGEKSIWTPGDIIADGHTFGQFSNQKPFSERVREALAREMVW